MSLCSYLSDCQCCLSVYLWCKPGGRCLCVLIFQIVRLLIVNPADRLTAKDALRHPFIRHDVSADWLCDGDHDDDDEDVVNVTACYVLKM